MPRRVCYVRLMEDNNTAQQFTFYSLAETPAQQRARFEREIERKLASNAKVGI